jgi:DNA-binding response OmpR family regulator
MGVVGLDSKRVLIVEDDYLIAMYLASQVTEAGYNLIGMARSVEAALDIIATADVDCAIVDVELMGERTFRVADALAARHIPFVFATAMSRDNAPAHYANVPWLEKPFSPGALHGALDDVMGPAKKDGC